MEIIEPPFSSLVFSCPVQELCDNCGSRGVYQHISVKFPSKRDTDTRIRGVHSGARDGEAVQTSRELSVMHYVLS